MSPCEEICHKEFFSQKASENFFTIQAQCTQSALHMAFSNRVCIHQILRTTMGWYNCKNSLSTVHCSHEIDAIETATSNALRAAAITFSFADVKECFGNGTRVTIWIFPWQDEGRQFQCHKRRNYQCIRAVSLLPSALWHWTPNGGSFKKAN